LLTNIWPGWKRLTQTNTLDYYDVEFVTSVQSLT